MHSQENYEEINLQSPEFTAIIIVVTFIVLFFGLAIYMVKRTMDLDKERIQKGIDPDEKPPTTTLVKEKEVVTEIVKVRCRSCGALSLERDSFCEHCGAKI